MADMTWDEVERALRERIASHELDGLNALELEYQLPGQPPIREAKIRQHREWCERQSAALTKALRCVVAVRWMEVHGVGVVSVVYKGKSGWESDVHEASELHDTIVRLCNVQTDVGWPTPLEALEAAMAAVKGESENG